MNNIERATHLHDYVVHLEFDDGTSGAVDLAHYPGRGPIFAPLADLEFFKEFRLEGGTLTWPNGADIAPERLYELLTTANKATGRVR